MNHHIADTNQFMLLVCMLKKNSLNNFVAIFAEIVLVQVGARAVEAGLWSL